MRACQLLIAFAAMAALSGCSIFGGSDEPTNQPNYNNYNGSTPPGFVNNNTNPNANPNANPNNAWNNGNNGWNNGNGVNNSWNNNGWNTNSNVIPNRPNNGNPGNPNEVARDPSFDHGMALYSLFSGSSKKSEEPGLGEDIAQFLTLGVETVNTQYKRLFIPQNSDR